MPEGHTIHRLARDHTKHFVGQKVCVESPQGRFSAEAREISGKKLTEIEAHGKHLFYQFGRHASLHVHLGLYGKFRLFKNPMPEPRGAVRVRMIGRTHGFDLNGPNQCEILMPHEVASLRDRLGADPLRSDSDPEVLWQRVSKSKKAIGAILLDQSIIAGVGNIYRCEILFLLGIAPTRPGNQLQRIEFDQLWSLTKELLEIGVKYNRIITVPRAASSKPLSRLASSERVNIYKKSSCPKCSGEICQSKMAARTLYHCQLCQAD
jgi:endonuclease VIII